MKNPLTLKNAKRSAIIGGYLFCIKTLGQVARQRDAEKTRADTMSAMFGSLAAFTGEANVAAWEKMLEDRQQPEDSIEITAPIDDVEPGS